MAESESALRPAEIFDQAAGRYDRPLHERFYRHVAAELISRFPDDLRADNILEVGAGTGFATEELRTRFPAAKIMALEPAAGMMARGSRKTNGAVSWRCETLSDMPPGSYDLIASFMSFHWLEEPEQQKLMQLAAGGTLALALPLTGGLALGGNRAIIRTVAALGGPRRWPRRVRRVTAVVSLLKERFYRVASHNLGIREEYESYEAMANSLFVRGALHSLFDGDAEQARLIIGRQDSQSRPGRVKAEINWQIGLLVASS